MALRMRNAWEDRRLPPTAQDRRAILHKWEDLMAIIEIQKLSTDERLQLIKDLWESLTEIPEGLPLTASQRAELDRRLDRLERDGPTGMPANEALSRYD
jgi:putative addiction module component (TIGR02574 family)